MTAHYIRRIISCPSHPSASISAKLPFTWLHWENVARCWYARSSHVPSCWPIPLTCIHRSSVWIGMSKRGNLYLRRMLIHGARAVLFRVKYDTGGLGQWVHRLSQRAPRNKVVVAIQQTSPHRLGRVVQRQRLSPSTAAT